MTDLKALLNQRIKKSENATKMTEMAKQSATGNRSSFTGIFGFAELSPHEREYLQALLQEYGQDDEDISDDLEQLAFITSEVKAINNQAALLHGERIKKAHSILIRYRDGAFSAWLIATYGNRQTPYNLMQYYEFYESIPKDLRPQLESMPRQAVYTLASRAGDLKTKQKIVANYQGETKAELLSLIRQAFPLDNDDKRRVSMGESMIAVLSKLYGNVTSRQESVTNSQKRAIIDLLDRIRSLIA